MQIEFAGVSLILFISMTLGMRLIEIKVPFLNYPLSYVVCRRQSLGIIIK